MIRLSHATVGGFERCYGEECTSIFWGLILLGALYLIHTPIYETCQSTPRLAFHWARDIPNGFDGPGIFLWFESGNVLTSTLVQLIPLRAPWIEKIRVRMCNPYRSMTLWLLISAQYFLTKELLQFWATQEYGSRNLFSCLNSFGILVAHRNAKSWRVHTYLAGRFCNERDGFQ